jgi:sRNA-binding protein
MSDLTTRDGLTAATLTAALAEKNGDNRWATLTRFTTFAALAAHLAEGSVRTVAVEGGAFRLSATPVDGELDATDTDLPEAIRTYADGSQKVSHTARGAVLLGIKLSDPLATIGLDGRALATMAKEAADRAAKAAQEAAEKMIADQAARIAELEAKLAANQATDAPKPAPKASSKSAPKSGA